MSQSGVSPLRAVFMGTPAFAAKILSIVLDSSGVDIVAVYTQPDRPSGRGRQHRASDVKELALDRGLPVFQPEHFKPGAEGDAAVAELAALRPDVLLVAAYGLLLPQRVLDIPACMPINVHASLLPKYRGAAPIQRAIMNGDPFTGITIMHMEAALDSGPILLQKAVGIDMNDTSASLHDELAVVGGILLVDALARLSAGKLKAFAQDSSRSSYAAKLSKEEATLDLRLPVYVLHSRLRGLSPWPGGGLVLRRSGHEDLAVTVIPGCWPLNGPLPDTVDDSRLATIPGEKSSRPGTIFLGTARTHTASAPAAGTLPEDALLVRCGDGWYAFPELRPAGKKSMPGRAFFNGYLKDSPDAHFVIPS